MSSKTRNGRRALVAAAAVALSVLLQATPAATETRREYVNRYVFLLDWVTRSESWISSHLEDAGLCRAAHAVAERMVEIARRMTPPSEFAAIHPHLLLVLENTERMYELAAEGDRDGYRRHRRVVQEEQRLIGEILQAEGRFMPVVAP